MTGHNRILSRRWLLLALAVVLIASHALVLRFALQHKRLSASVVAGVMILVVMMHLRGRMWLYFFKRLRPLRLQDPRCATLPDALSHL